MARNKLSVDFTGVDRYIERLQELGGESTKRAIEGALKASQAYVANSAAQAMKPHDKTGAVSRSIVRNAPVEWTGDTVAAIPVGFKISDGGLPSIFLMYGTKVHGQPHITPDRALYNAVYGAKVKRKVRELQRAAFDKVIERVMKS